MQETLEMQDNEEKAKNTSSLPKYAVIVAGGKGSRMGSELPKQFLIINGKPLLYYCLKTFLKSYDDLKIILVLPEECMGNGQEIIDAFFDYDRIQLVIGGRTRFHSVQNGLAQIEDESIVLVHDAVRCLVTETLIRRCAEAVNEMGSAVPVIDCKDSVRLILEDGNESLDRNNLKLVQTPQAFYSKILKPAFNIDFKEQFTDEATVVEAFGLKVQLVPGEEQNIKITHPLDLLIAEKILAER